MSKANALIVTLLLVLATTACTYISGPVIMGSLSALQPPSPPTLFTTPEDAIRHYVAGVAAGDVTQILQACAVEEMATNFRFDRYTERLGVLLPTQALAPADHPLYIEMNRAQLTAQHLNRVKILTYSLLAEEPVADAAPIRIDAARTTQFLNAVDPQRLATLTVEQIALPNAMVMASELYQENTARAAAVHGADEWSERMTLIRFAGDTYLLGFTLVRYGESWKISEAVSPLAGTNPLGAAEPLTVAEFESMTNHTE